MRKKPINPDDMDSASAPGESNRDLAEYKEKMGLPKWKDLSKELEELGARHDTTWASELQAKIELHQKYLEYQSLLYQNFSSMGLQHLNSIQNAIELQLNLFELQEKLKQQGINPLESEEYMKGREMLGKEMQFLHKHKLDVAQFQQNMSVAKRRSGDDDLFVVEATVDDKQ